MSNAREVRVKAKDMIGTLERSIFRLRHPRLPRKAEAELEEKNLQALIQFVRWAEANREALARFIREGRSQ